jgi:putative oxidoreductase
MELIQSLFIFLGRICISVPFLWAAYNMFRNWNETKSYLENKNIPQVNLVLPIYLGLKVIGAILVLLGWQAHLGALLLLIATVASAIKLHPFWTFHGKERVVEETVFMRDVIIIGGLTLLLAVGSGSFSA